MPQFAVGAVLLIIVVVVAAAVGLIATFVPASLSTYTYNIEHNIQ